MSTWLGVTARLVLFLLIVQLLTPSKALPEVFFDPTSISTRVTPNEVVSASIVLKNDSNEELRLVGWRVTGVGTKLSGSLPGVLLPGEERVVQINLGSPNLLPGEYYSEVYIYYQQVGHVGDETGFAWRQGLVVVIPCFLEVVGGGKGFTGFLVGGC